MFSDLQSGRGLARAHVYAKSIYVRFQFVSYFSVYETPDFLTGCARKKFAWVLLLQLKDFSHMLVYITRDMIFISLFSSHNATRYPLSQVRQFLQWLLSSFYGLSKDCRIYVD